MPSMPPMPPPGGMPPAAGGVVFRQFAHHRFGGNHQTSHRGRGLQRRARHFGRVRDAELDHVAVIAGCAVVALVAVQRTHLFVHHRRFVASVLSDLAQRRCHGTQGDLNAYVLVFVVAGHAFDFLQGANQGDAAARHDAFFDRGACGVQRVFGARLLFLHLHFRRSAYLDNGNAAGQLGQSLLQLLAVVVGGGFLDLGANLLDAAFNVGFGAGAVDDRGVLLGGGKRAWQCQDRPAMRLPASGPLLRK